MQAGASGFVGGTVADTAKAATLSEGNVRNYLSAAMAKTGARTRAEAVRLAGDNGWLLQCFPPICPHLQQWMGDCSSNAPRTKA